MLGATAVRLAPLAAVACGLGLAQTAAAAATAAAITAIASAIASISVYSSRAHAFIAVVPSVRHTETHELCDAHTYQMRLWTRAECLTHRLINGIGSMWIA